MAVALAAGLALLGAVGYGFILYDQATKPDRSAPDVVVSNYLRALLVERDDVRAGLYACRDGSGLAEIRALRDDMLDRERRFDISIRVTWGSLAVAEDGDRARVTTDLVRTISDGSEQSRQSWRFEVVEQDGWRVCGATRVS